MTKYMTPKSLSNQFFKYIILLLCSFMLIGLGQASFSQDKTTFRPFGTASEDWDRALNEIELSQRTAGNLSDTLKANLDAVSKEASAVRADAITKLDYWNNLLGALGKVAEGETEPEKIALERERLTKERDDYFTRMKISDLAIARVNLVLTNQAKKLQDEEVADYFEHGAIPLFPNNWSAIQADFGHFLQWTKEPGHNINRGGRSQDVLSLLSPQVRSVVVTLQVVCFLILLYFIQRALYRHARRFGSGYSNPNIIVKIAVRLGVALLSAGIIFLLMLGILLVSALLVKFSIGNFTSATVDQLKSVPILSLDINTPADRVIADTVEMSLIYIVLNALISPRLPKFALVNLNLPKLTNLTYHIPLVYFLASLCEELYIGLKGLSVNSSTITLVTFCCLTGLALYINSLRKFYLSVNPLDSAEDESDADSGEAVTLEEDAEEKKESEWTKRFVNKLIYAVLIFIIAVSAFGYTYMATQVICAIALVSFTYITLKGVRTILYEVVAYFNQIFKREMNANKLPSVNAAMQAVDTGSEKPVLLLILWGITLNVLAIIAFFGLTMLILGFPMESIVGYVKSISNGISVGERTVSLRNIFDGLVVLTLGILLAKFLNRTIIKSQTLSMAASEGVRYSIGTITQYVVMILSFLLAVSVMGLDLSSLSLFAGALGVGIGFGLQKVIMNFVSGLILLIQRPLQIGDWVEIGPNSGIVKRVNLMNTELETWQRASVIFPNSDVMTATFVNRTRGSKQGRIEVKVGVAYGSDLEVVKKILIDCAKAHPLVMKYQPINVLFLDFADSSLNFELRCFTHDVFTVMMISSELRFSINKEFAKADIEIPFPQRVVHHVEEDESDDGGVAVNKRLRQRRAKFMDHDTAAGPDAG